MEFLINSVIGAAGGFLTGQAGKGSGLGTAGNVATGVVGGAGFPWLGTAMGLLTGGTNVTSIITSVAGSVLVPYLIGLFNKKSA